MDDDNKNEADYAIVQHILNGHELSAAEAKSLEKRLKENPLDSQARFQLLGYYFGKQDLGDIYQKKRTEITLWLIDNMPDCRPVGEPWCFIENAVQPDLYKQGKEHWLKQLTDNADNTAVIGNAARYFLRQEPELAEELLGQAMKIEPNDSEWSRELANLLRRAGPLRVQDALQAIKDAISKEPEEHYQYYMLDDLAELAFDAGKLDEAAEAAQKCLSLAFTFGRDWNDGNAIHNSNAILGRIALKNGDIDSAKKHLALAGDTPGSPQLDSFGPDMDLAEELLSAGEIESVVAYLEACKTFWNGDCERGLLSAWISEIRQGGTPDFSGRTFSMES